MRWSAGFVCAFLATLFQLSYSQNPPRLQIPGAFIVQGGGRPAPQRQQRINALNTEFIPRPRRPNAPLPIREIRPVIEDEEDFPPPPSSGSNLGSFDAEVNKLSISAVQSALNQAGLEDDLPPARPSPVQFRPERPIPVTRDQIRDQPPPRPLPVIRQESRPPPRPIRPVVRQEIDDEEENIPRQPIRQKAKAPQYISQQFKAAPRPKGSQDDDELNKRRRPVVQILRKYRTDNEDGSITWGFENEDGTFKEETLGIDCVIKGKYGYVDPDGVKREFEYETGNKCDPNAEEELDEDELPPQPPRVPLKKPVNIGKQQSQPQIQYRPQLAQYQ